MDPTQDPSSQATKPGWQTSEVYVGIASALAVVLGKLTDVQSVVVGVVAVAYIIARSYSKGVIAKARSMSRLAKEGC